MSLTDRRTFHVSTDLARLGDSIARARNVLRQDVWDRAIARALDRDEPALLALLANRIGRQLASAGGVAQALTIPQIAERGIAVPAFVGMRRLVRVKGEWTWEAARG